MAKTEVNLQDAAKAEMEALVEQHNQLVQEISEANGRLAEGKQMIIEKQGYMKGLEDCEKQCKEK